MQQNNLYTNLSESPQFRASTVHDSKSVDREESLWEENTLNLPTNLDNCEGPTLFFCSSCKRQTVSICTFKPGTGTYICSFIMCIVYFVVGAFIPFVNEECQDKHQQCPHCNSLAGLKRFKVCGQ
ncbi:hypothetical protein pb186bvf_005511 [Paramecium bursaria]